MKIRKNVVAWIGIIICVLVAGIILALPSANNLFALLPAAIFIPLVITLAKPDTAKEDDEDSEEEPKKVNWPLTICWTLVALAAISTIAILVLFGWWFLLPCAILFGLLIWLAYLLNWHNLWSWLFIALIIIAIVLLGVFGIVKSNTPDNIMTGFGNNGHLDTLYVDTLVVENADVENADVENADIENADIENAAIENSNVNNQHVKDESVENQAVKDQTVENQEVKPTEPQPTEPQPTEPQPTEPKPTDPAHKHAYTDNVTAPTCDAKGYTTHTCSCGHSYTDSYKDALGHSYKSVVTEPTCNEKGYTTHTCERCGHNYTDSNKVSLGHSYKSTVVEPTTSAGGYTEHKCERCGHTYKSDFTDKLPEATEPEVTPAIKCAHTIRYGETLYVNLEGIDASDLKVSNKAFVSVDVISSSRVAITLTEDVTGYITVTDRASGTNVVIDIVE